MAEKNKSTSGVKVQALDINVLRITHYFSEDNSNIISPAWLDDVIINNCKDVLFNGRVDIKDGLVSISDADGKIKYFEKEFSFHREKWKLNIDKQSGEFLYGWGEQFTHFHQKYGKFKLSARESPEFLQNKQSYSAIPYYFSSACYAFFLLNAYETDWTISENSLKVEAHGGGADYLVILGENPKEILDTYTRLTGRPKLIPRWAFGLWATCYPQENQFRVLQYVREHRERQIALDVLVLDYHWEEHFH
ncbi:MAG: glycoside hydrolase family 31 protein, partial [Anaerolineae bacterium]|nr:glycoside hydrolase family 31 protein [Anaerolineae bacterium]